jgi:hypothetical protein
VIRSLRSFAPLLVVALIALSACDGDSPTTPTPAPAPAPAPTPAPPPPPPPPPAPAALESISISPSVVTGQTRPTATIRLTAPAPAGNAPVFVETTNSDVAKVPANISVAAGETTNSFAIDTSTVRNPTTVRISARYESVTMSAELTVLPPPLEAQFRVVSANRGEDACVIVSAAGAVDCLFDASRSTGFPAVYRWRLTVAGKEVTLDMPEGSATFTPATDCNLLSGGNISQGEVPMLVVLRVEDRQGNLSSPVQRIIDLIPNGNCGY